MPVGRNAPKREKRKPKKTPPKAQPISAAPVHPTIETEVTGKKRKSRRGEE